MTVNRQTDIIALVLCLLGRESVRIKSKPRLPAHSGAIYGSVTTKTGSLGTRFRERK